jgi:hypothetical protein
MLGLRVASCERPLESRRFRSSPVASCRAVLVRLSIQTIEPYHRNAPLTTSKTTLVTFGTHLGSCTSWSNNLDSTRLTPTPLRALNCLRAASEDGHDNTHTTWQQHEQRPRMSALHNGCRKRENRLGSSWSRSSRSLATVCAMRWNGSTSTWLRSSAQVLCMLFSLRD